ncbi:MAG: TIGR02186 family protein [Burkholderiales bacterium]|nr:TIGR02186 family protein [Burkholderiales bacterium]
MMRWLLCLLFASGCILPAGAWAEEPLVVAPTTSEVKITTDFAGTTIEAVGAMSGPGELIIKLVGPKQEATLSRETKLGPFWVGGESVKLQGAPSLLFLYATAPIATILPPAEQQKYGLLLEGVPVRVAPHLKAHAAEDWRKAFYRIKERQGYYHEYDTVIRVFGNRLFVADMRLPGDLQVGTYTIETLLVKSGKVAGHTIGTFNVRLSGVERWVWNAAHDHAWLFGSLFTLLAMLLGLALNAFPFRQTR